MALLAPASAFAQNPSPSGPANGAPSSTPSVAPGGEADINAALELYRYRLLFTGTKLRAYPSEAMQRRLTGTATVEIEISRDGKLQKDEIVTSSGHRILDDYATELLKAAVPLTEIPSPLHNTAFNLRVAVVFVLPPD
jgi:TonB family protein